MKFSLVTSVVLAVSSACMATAAPDYYPDKVVPLPVDPASGYTNIDTGTVSLGDLEKTYISVVENELNYKNWKEWAISYHIQPTASDWYISLKVDYCYLNDNTTIDRPGFSRLTLEDSTGTNINTALWQIYYGSPNTPSQNLEWSAVGFPFDTPGAGSLALAFEPTPDWKQDTFPFTWNPEWVSLEFVGKNVDVTYKFVDWCVPEPMSMSLLTLGSLAFLRRKH